MDHQMVAVANKRHCAAELNNDDGIGQVEILSVCMGLLSQVQAGLNPLLFEAGWEALLTPELNFFFTDCEYFPNQPLGLIVIQCRDIR